MSGSSDLFHYMTDQARAWVRANGTREGSAEACARLKPFLLASVSGFVEQGGERFEQATVAQVVESVARWWSRAGWGHFARRGLYRFFVRFGQGAHPRGPEVEHLKARYYKPRHDAAIAAISELQAAGVERPTQRQIAELASRRSGLDVTRSAARDWNILETPRLTAALAALPPTIEALARALREDLPAGMVHVVPLADVAAALWTPSTCESTQRVHLKRAADAMLRIGAGRVGMTVAIVGDLVIVGRQRSIPADPAAFAANARVRKLRIGRIGTPETQAKQDLRVVEEMLRYVEAFTQQVDDEAYALVERKMDGGMDEASAIREIVGAASDVPLEIGRMMIDDSIAMTLGVLPHRTFESVLGGPVRAHARIEDHDRHEAEHYAAFAELRRRYGEGQCFSSLYRWAHAKGGLPLAPFAQRIAAALEGTTDIAAAKAALPAICRPGRERVYAVAKVETETAPRIGEPILAAPRRVVSLPKMTAKVVPQQSKEFFRSNLTEKEKEAVDAGMPWFLSCG